VYTGTRYCTYKEQKPQPTAIIIISIIAENPQGGREIGKMKLVASGLIPKTKSKKPII